ncbi:hypothetical protein L3X38_019211 [Prunus dulcis]|uniref:Uncharacterized protein n=1 Tax=Prunus dulcis TaxID=3755 RepID=A0AAD4ZAU5_PRUDU|nr:hypothetical protein L3X38_019211 [Prunus dulcis]
MSKRRAKNHMRCNLSSLKVCSFVLDHCQLKRKQEMSEDGNLVLYFALTLFELEKAFIDCADEEDAVKLGFLYFDVFERLGSEKPVNIDMRYLKLLEEYACGVMNFLGRGRRN